MKNRLDTSGQQLTAMFFLHVLQIVLRITRFDLSIVMISY